MTNKKPFFIFVAVVVVLGAAFWGVLQFASRYNERLASPQPKQVTQDPSHNDPRPQAPAPTPQTTTPVPTPKPTTPPPTSKPSTSPPAPPQPAPSTQPRPTPPPSAVPATGASIDTLLASVLLGVTTFLALKLRRQQVQLRPNR